MTIGTIHTAMISLSLSLTTLGGGVEVTSFQNKCFNTYIIKCQRNLQDPPKKNVTKG